LSHVFAEHERVQWNEDHPVRQADDAEEKNPGQNAAHYFQRQPFGLLCSFPDRAWNQRYRDRRQRSETIEPVVEHGQSGRPMESVNAYDRDEIPRERCPCVRVRRKLVQVLRQRRRRDWSPRA